MRLPKKKLKILVEYFCSKPVRKVYLFGSYARGDATRASDVDVLLDVDLRSNRPVDLARYIAELSALLSMPADVHIGSRVMKYARANIERDKILIHRARRSAPTRGSKSDA